MNAVVLLGPPGAGKGTVAEVLVDRGFRHVSTGDLLRHQINLETPLGLQAKALINQGRLVSDETVVEMVRELMADSPSDSSFLFDGFPRTLLQAEKLDVLLTDMGGRLVAVVLFACSNDVIVERLAGRRTCSKCGAVYHMDFHPPENDLKCDVDGCGLAQRPDDNEATIRKRLEVYAERTSPIIDYYATRNLIHEVDAEQEIEAVRSDVLNHLGLEGAS